MLHFDTSSELGGEGKGTLLYQAIERKGMNVMLRAIMSHMTAKVASDWLT